MMHPVTHWDAPNLAFDDNGILCYYYTNVGSYLEAAKNGIECDWSDIDEKFSFVHYPKESEEKEEKNSSFTIGDSFPPCQTPLSSSSYDFDKNLFTKSTRLKKTKCGSSHKQRTSKKKSSRKLFQHRKDLVMETVYASNEDDFDTFYDFYEENSTHHLHGSGYWYWSINNRSLRYSNDWDWI